MNILNIPYTDVQNQTIRASIAKNISLLIQTREGSCPFDFDFGTQLHYYELKQLNTTYERENLEKHLQQKIEKYEPRLMSVEVRLEIPVIHTYVINDKTHISENQVLIHLSAKLKSNLKSFQEGFRFEYHPDLTDE